MSQEIIILPKCPCAGCKDHTGTCRANCNHGYYDWEKEYQLKKKILRDRKNKRVAMDTDKVARILNSKRQRGEKARAY